MLARQLAEAGLSVLVQDIRAEAAERVAREIGDRARPLVFDVSDVEAVNTAASALEAQGATLNLLWINAGVASDQAILSASANEVSWAYGVNVLGAVWTAHAFAPFLMRADGPRHVGLTASVAALRLPGEAYTLYAATKQAALGVAEALRREFADAGVAMTILCPGLLHSQIWNGAKARPGRYGGPNPLPESSLAAAPWRTAKDPILMWPHIAHSIENGGGYCICATDGGVTQAAINRRMQEISEAITEV